MRPLTLALAGGLALAATLPLATQEGSAPGVSPPQRVAPPQAERSSKPRHELWTRILKKHVNADGWVDYETLRKAGAADLKAYLGQIARTDLRSLRDENERMAFWINAYNAVCIQKLIDHDLPSEVPHAVFFGANIFKESTYRVAGKVRSLDDIEHGILRKRFRDNRVHAALVCGASSCPRLRPEAFEGATLSRQLDEEARRWVGAGLDRKGRRKNVLDRASKTLRVSKIFDWFQEDFGGNEAGVIAFVRRHSSAEDRKFLEANRVRVRYLEYDWSLNKR